MTRRLFVILIIGVLALTCGLVLREVNDRNARCVTTPEECQK